MLYRWVILCWVVPVIVLAQLTLEEDLPEPSEDPGEEQVEDVPLNEEAVRALTRQIQSRFPQTEPALVREDSPGKEHFQKVIARIGQSPPRVRLTLEGEQGSARTVWMDNHFLDVETSAGTLPLLWSEIRLMVFSESPIRFELQGEDGLSGTLQIRELTVEREDASTEVVPLDTLRQIRVVPEP